MPLKNIYIARHGYRANWLPLPHPPNPTGIDSDPPLAPHGVDQAKQLAGYLMSLPGVDRPEFILTSPFYRCVETAEPTAELLDIPIVLERGVGEWYKKDREVIPIPANYDSLQRFFPKLADEKIWHRDNTVGVIPDVTGETEEDIMARGYAFWKLFIPVIEKKFPAIETVLIVTHAATKLALGMSLLGHSNVFEPLDKENNTLRAGVCSLDKFVWDSGKWNLKMNGNTEFLAEGEEMHWDFHNGYEAGSDEDIKARREEALRKQQEKEKQRPKNPSVTGIAEGADHQSNIEYEVRP